MQAFKNWLCSYQFLSGFVAGAIAVVIVVRIKFGA